VQSQQYDLSLSQELTATQRLGNTRSQLQVSLFHHRKNLLENKQDYMKMTLFKFLFTAKTVAS